MPNAPESPIVAASELDEALAFFEAKISAEIIDHRRNRGGEPVDAYDALSALATVRGLRAPTSVRAPPAAPEKTPTAAPRQEPSREEILAARRRGAGPNAPPWIIEGISEAAWRAVPENAASRPSPRSPSSSPSR